MYALYIIHLDYEGPDGQTQENVIAKFTDKVLAEATKKLCEIDFPHKAFFYCEEEAVLINPEYSTLKRIVTLES